MTAKEFILIPKHLYVKEQPHAARVFHDKNIKLKKTDLDKDEILEEKHVRQTASNLGQLLFPSFR